jgi:hypothetical protein
MRGGQKEKRTARLTAEGAMLAVLRLVIENTVYRAVEWMVYRREERKPFMSAKWMEEYFE